MIATWIRRPFWFGVVLGAAAVTIVWVCLSSFAPLFGAEPKIEVTIELLHRDDEQCVVNVIVRNTGRIPFSFDGHVAPWYFDAENVYVALLRKSSFPGRYYPIKPGSTNHSLPAGFYKLAPGESLQWEVYLDWYFTLWSPALVEQDLTLVWRYEPVLREEFVSPAPITGSLKIPGVSMNRTRQP